MQVEIIMDFLWNRCVTLKNNRNASNCVILLFCLLVLKLRYAFQTIFYIECKLLHNILQS